MSKSAPSELLTYVASIGSVPEQVEMRYEDGNVWLSQQMMAKLYGVPVPEIDRHLKRLIADGEVDLETVKRYAIVQQEDAHNVSRAVDHFNLEVVVAVGLKIENPRAVQFRKWAAQIVKDYIIQGWVMDEPRLRDGARLGEDYFEQLLEQVREIRLSERRFHQKITDIYATAVDYDATASTTRDFYAAVQNFLQRVLGERELDELNRIVSVYLDLAEMRAQRHIPTTMEDWSSFLARLLTLNEREFLGGTGRVSAEEVRDHAVGEWDSLRFIQDRVVESDYDRFLRLEQAVARDENTAREADRDT